MVNIPLKWAYELAAKSDGMRVLVNGLWSRGLTKLAAKIDHWMKVVTPATERRQWLGSILFRRAAEPGLFLKGGS